MWLSFIMLKKNEEGKMTEAIITGIVAITVCMVNNYYQHKAVKQQHDKTIGLIE